MRTNAMRQPDPFADSIYEEQTHLAEDELSSFIAAVKASYGQEQAKLSAEESLEESELMAVLPDLKRKIGARPRSRLRARLAA
jgi:hypothetical protein